MRKQEGQAVLLLILVITVALAIGLSIVQKSLVDISTASKVEQSSRAFSAAEAGIEKSLQLNISTSVNFSENSSAANAVNSGLIPPVPDTGSRQAALEYPSLAKEDVAQVWLADYNSTTNPPAAAYQQSTLDVYWGNSSQDQAALELTLVYHNGTAYQSQKWYLDQTSRDNGFGQVSGCSGGNTPQGGSTAYQCKETINLPTSASSRLILIRARLLYNSASQPFAVQALGTCGTTCSLPPQARSITSTGVSGETQRRVQLFQESKVAPPYFDYAIFSDRSIIK